MVRADENGLLGPLQPMSPFIQCGMDGMDGPGAPDSLHHNSPLLGKKTETGRRQGGGAGPSLTAGIGRPRCLHQMRPPPR